MLHHYGNSHAMWDHTVLHGRGDIYGIYDAQHGRACSSNRRHSHLCPSQL